VSSAVTHPSPRVERVGGRDTTQITWLFRDFTPLLVL
jgi:hypothetical protein